MEHKLIGAIFTLQVLACPVGLGAANLVTEASDEQRPTPTLTVLIQNYARVPADRLRPALREAGRVFQEAGIRTAWLECTPNDFADEPKQPECDRTGASEGIVLRLLPRKMGERMGFSNNSFGYALTLEPGRVGRIASVFVYRMEELARSWGAGEQPAILGHLIAHELGHLVLGVGSHAATGVMSFPWAKEELKAAVRGRIGFSEQ